MKCSTLMNKLIDKNLIFECCDYQDIRLFYFLKPLDDDRWIIHNNRTSNPNLQISQYTNATNSTCIRNIPPVQFRLSYSSFAITKRGRCAPPFTNSKEGPSSIVPRSTKAIPSRPLLSPISGVNPVLPRSLTLPSFLSRPSPVFYTRISALSSARYSREKKQRWATSKSLGGGTISFCSTG